MFSPTHTYRRTCLSTIVLFLAIGTTATAEEGWLQLNLRTRGRVSENGDQYRAVGWVTEHLQTIRFEVMSAVGDIRGASILDVGCGVGHYLDWLNANGFVGDYIGLEVQEPMVEIARKNHPKESFPRASFEFGDFLNNPAEYEADYVVASGIFPLADLELLRLTVEAMFDRARIGVAFNCLSAFTPRREPDHFHRQRV